MTDHCNSCEKSSDEFPSLLFINERFDYHHKLKNPMICENCWLNREKEKLVRDKP